MTEPIVFKNKNVSIYQNKGMNPGTVSRRVFIDVDDVNEIPSALFNIKISQSKNPELAGKPVFKHFRFKLGEDPFNVLAPGNVTPATPVEEIKKMVIDKLGNANDAQFQVMANVNGQFANIETPEGRFTLFDDKQFPNEDLTKRGRPGYYLNNKAKVTVTLTEATGNYGNYYQVDFATDQLPDEIFVKQSKSKVWGEDDDTTTTPADNDGDSKSQIW